MSSKDALMASLMMGASLDDADERNNNNPENTNQEQEGKTSSQSNAAANSDSLFGPDVDDDEEEKAANEVNVNPPPQQPASQGNPATANHEIQQQSNPPMPPQQNYPPQYPPQQQQQQQQMQYPPQQSQMPSSYSPQPPNYPPQQPHYSQPQQQQQAYGNPYSTPPRGSQPGSHSYINNNGMIHSMTSNYPSPQAGNNHMQASQMQGNMQGSMQQYPPQHSQPPQMQYPPQSQQQQQSMMMNSSNAMGMHPSHNHGGMPSQTNSVVYPPQQQQQQQQSGNITAGMHNIVPGQGTPPQMRWQQQPQSQPSVPPQPLPYARVTVDQPILLAGHKANFFTKAVPYWSYQITTQLHGNQGVWVVRRRFRDVVALEDRLRVECPGAILPPRPDKHATRALEEATAQQSHEFALQRAQELSTYLNQMVQHPWAAPTHTVRFFLSLQDELGTAWPEVSTNALTRLATAGVEAAVKTAEQWTPESMSADSEDNAELLALYSAESVRMGAVLQAVPKMEGALSLLQEHAEVAGSVGMEWNRWLKPSTLMMESHYQGASGTGGGSSMMGASVTDTPDGMDIAASGLLRSGRRSKRLALELSAAAACYSQHHKLCRYERMAFGDRRAALQRRAKERKAMMQGGGGGYGQSSPYGGGGGYYPGGGYPPQQDMRQEADEIGHRLLTEVGRIGADRRREWAASLKILAASFKEAAAERTAIWRATLTQFDQQYPGYYRGESDGNVPGGMPPQHQYHSEQETFSPGQEHQHGQHEQPSLVQPSEMGGGQAMYEQSSAEGGPLPQQQQQQQHTSQ